MVVRHGFSKMISIESELITRKYNTLVLLVMSMQASADFGLLATNYPSKVLFTIGNLFMNASIGLGINFMPQMLQKGRYKIIILKEQERIATFLSNLKN